MAEMGHAEWAEGKAASSWHGIESVRALNTTPHPFRTAAVRPLIAREGSRGRQPARHPSPVSRRGAKRPTEAGLADYHRSRQDIVRRAVAPSPPTGPLAGPRTSPRGAGATGPIGPAGDPPPGKERRDVDDGGVEAVRRRTARAARDQGSTRLRTTSRPLGPPPFGRSSAHSPRPGLSSRPLST
ncbi:hypothetical protein THAOC_01611 [Thalassiosira oceanica]|uniref:Uncharacterized protein n=1 Tax=Thalassiosira oceanica TaxID=159749 RepID=K0TQT7_THAOC|nr:hypothetical protein THAOC_01611 [Thalassiosira oceanica]|eukprot:EJK76617.1 hypothetical protein THAOC_01611 [Thalassiosira oceanica]